MDKRRMRKFMQDTAAIVMVLVMMCAVPQRAAAAVYNYPYPVAANKKGLGLGADMEEDALELNVTHASINFPISMFIARKSERNSRSSYSYKYKGKKYWFRKANINAWDKILKKLQGNDMIVTGILLMQKRSDLKNLIYPSARNRKASFYAWNMDGGTNQQMIEAAISYLANRYSSGKHGRVVGWVVGNEIDSASEWNNAGGIDFNSYMDLYARMFEMTSRIVRGVYANARVYVPLDHFWNIIYSNNYTARSCLDTFAARMARDGYTWNLAYHAYNGDLMQPSITDPQYFETTWSLDTQIITMKNLGVLTGYIRDRYGADKRIILDEHGYSSTWKGADVTADQSKAIALSYYLAEADPMVDEFDYYSQVDQNELTSVGASFGIWKVSKRETATEKKASWTTFKYMDTDLDDAVLNEARATAEQMTGQSFSGKRTVSLNAQQESGKYKAAVNLSKGWKKCGAVRTISRKKKGFVLKHDGSRNKNVYWGVQRDFGALSASAYPRLVMTLKSGRLAGGAAELLVRVFSTDAHMYESSGVIYSGKTARICVDLGSWQYRDAVTRIQILVKRRSGSWKKNASVTVTDIGLL